MRILITGASGNVGCGVVGALRRSLPSAELVGVCRRPPRGTWMADAVEWVSIDLSAPQAERELVAALRDVDVVVHLAVAVHPPRDTDYLYRANVVGSQAVWNAMRSADVRHLVYASSLGVYGPGHGSPVDEHWPRTGQPTSSYSAHKILVERQLDVLADQWPELIQARIRPTVVVQRDAAALFRRLYLGSLVPRAAIKALRAGAFPAIPLPAGLSLQFVHADDVGDVVVALIRSRAQGSFNVAADVLDTAAVAGLIHARPISISASLTRRVVLALARLRVIAVTPGWYDVATNSPLMDVSRARTELGWSARWSSTISAHELIDGLADGAVGPTPATGLEEEDVMDNRLTARRVHDATLAWWAALTVVRAVQRRRPGRLDAAVVAAHLAAGTPLALDRVRERRRDPVAVLAPLAVGSSLVATLRGGWAPVGCLAVLGALAGADRRRNGRGPR